jgi:hypothetical protein
MAEPLNATFFTLKHRDRAVLLPATLVTIVIVALIVAAWVGLNWRTLSLMFELVQQGPSGQADEAQAGALFSGMMGIFASTMLFLFPLFIALAAYEAACLRWMIRGEAPGLFGLTIDHDTWRVWAIYWCWLVTQMVVSTVASVLMMPLMFMMMGDIVAQGPEPDSQATWNMILRMQAFSLIQYIPLAFIGIRLGPAAATSIARRRFSFFEAWTVTADRFWALFGSWILLWLLLALAYAILFAATYGPLYGDLWVQLFTTWPDFPREELQEFATRTLSMNGLLTIAAAYGGGLLLWTTYRLMAFGVNARAARAALEEGKIAEVPPDS